MSSRAAKWVAIGGGALNVLGLNPVGALAIGLQVVLNITNATVGSALAATGLPAGWVLNSASRTITGTPMNNDPIQFTITETLAGKANSPLANPMSFRVPVKVPTYDPVAAAAAAFSKPANIWAASKNIAAGATPASNLIAVLGHSLAFVNWGNDPSTPTENINPPTQGVMQSRGYAFWAQTLSNARVRFKRDHNFGYSGLTSTDLLAFVPIAAASPCGTVILDHLANDHGAAAISAATSIANTLAMIDTLTMAGKLVVILTTPPRGNGTTAYWAAGDANISNWLQVNDWLKRVAANIPGVLVADANAKLVDQSSTTGIFRAGMTSVGDLAHGGPAYAFERGKVLAAIFNTIFPPVDFLPFSNADVYHAVNNPRGLLNTNPMLLAAAGTAPSATATISTTNGSASIDVTVAAGAKIGVGYPITAAGISAGSFVQAFGTGNGGTGTYTISQPATATAAGVAATLTGGQVADGWTASISETNYSMATSKVISGGLTWQQMTLGSGVNAAGSSPLIGLSQAVSQTAGRVVAGDTLEAFCRIEVDAGMANVAGIFLQLQETYNPGAGNTTLETRCGDTGHVDGSFYPGEAWSGVFVTPPLTIPAGALSSLQARLRVQGQQGYQSSGVVRVTQFGVRKAIA